jgi:hypothetical protein
MQVCCEIFQSLGKPWKTLFDEAAQFASKLPPDRIISIAHSEDQDDAVVTVWYWSDAPAASPGPASGRAPRSKKR